MTSMFVRMSFDDKSFDSLSLFQGFSDVVASAANMQKFIDHSIKWMRKNGFDGLDMDWEYPGVGGDRGSKPEHKQAFTVLIQKLRAVS